MSVRPAIATVFAIIAASLLALAAPMARAANNAEQVIFSGKTAQFGFWIWCQNEQAPSSLGRSNYETDCNGAMYFYALGVVSHVTGEVSEPAEGVYVMDVQSRDGSVDCTLTNVPPIRRGPNNTVLAACTVDGQVLNLRATGAVVNATGP